MASFQPKKRIYTGPIDLGSQPKTWLAKHRSFASEDWIESQVRYCEWLPNKERQFLIYTAVFEGIKPLTILIKVQMFDAYAHVYHVHVLRKK